MKSLKRLLLLSLVVIMASSCGGDKEDNQVNAGLNPFNNGFNNNGQPNLSAAQNSQVQNVLNSFSCQNGQRLSQVQTYNTQNFQAQGGTTTIAGPFNQGTSAGTAGQIYIGISNFRDVMVVTKMGNGTQTSAFNVSLYMCTFTVSNVPYVADVRALSNFNAQQGITVTDNSSCGFGNVIAAKDTYMLSAQYQQYPQFNVWTTFFPVNNCN